MTEEQISRGSAYASLGCSVSFWAVFALYGLRVGLHLTIPGLGALERQPGWFWTLIEACGLVLAIAAAATAPRARLWRIALPVAFLMFLLTMYIMGS
jgi:hypothetical protein